MLATGTFDGVFADVCVHDVLFFSTHIDDISDIFDDIFDDLFADLFGDIFDDSFADLTPTVLLSLRSKGIRAAR